MFNLSVFKQAKKSSEPFPGWIFLGLIPVLIFPLFNLIPAPMVLTGHPWKVELVFSIFILLILVWTVFKKFGSNSLFSKSIPEKIWSRGFSAFFLLPMILFIIWSGLSALWAPSGQSVLHHTLIWAAYLIFFLVCLISITVQNSLKWIVLPVALVAIVLGLSTSLDFLGVRDFAAVEGTIRIRYAKFAEMILTAAPLLWALAFYGRSMKRSAFFLGAGICAWLTVMFSLSRGAFLAGIGGFLIFFVITYFFSQPAFRRKALRLGGLWLALTILVQIIFSIGSSIPATTDYLTGKNSNTDGNAAMRLYTWKVSRQMISDNPLVGVGADNFGIEFNQSRKNYALQSPGDEQNATGEYYMFERAHNEFIQIFAELGVIGVLIFILMFGGFGFLFITGFIRNSNRISPVLAGALAGLVAFFFSSMFSSFSFRALQNGLVFFLILAIAAFELLKIGRPAGGASTKSAFRWPLDLQKAAVVFSFGTLLLLAGSSLMAGLSQYFVVLAEQETEFSNAAPLYRKAIALNPENASAYFSFGIKLLIAKEPEQAGRNMRLAIDKGMGVTSVYSYLTTSQLMLKDPFAAERTLTEAVQIFPESVFTRVRLARILEQNGKSAESIKQLEKARSINEKQAEGWYSLINRGSDATVIRAREKKDLPELSDLNPTNALFAVLDEESFLNRFPRKTARTR